GLTIRKKTCTGISVIIRTGTDVLAAGKNGSWIYEDKNYFGAGRASHTDHLFGSGRASHEDSPDRRCYDWIIRALQGSLRIYKAGAFYRIWSGAYISSFR